MSNIQIHDLEFFKDEVKTINIGKAINSLAIIVDGKNGTPTAWNVSAPVRTAPYDPDFPLVETTNISTSHVSGTNALQARVSTAVSVIASELDVTLTGLDLGTAESLLVRVVVRFAA